MGAIYTSDTSKKTITDLLEKVSQKMNTEDYVEGGKIKSSVLPSYVDDVLEYANFASFPASGEEGKVYLDKSTNTQYRWSGSQYTNITSSVINDSSAGEVTTYSSQKINTLLSGKTSINNDTPSSSTTYSSNKLENDFQKKTITDVGEFFTATTVDGALQEVGELLDGLETLLEGI